MFYFNRLDDFGAGIACTYGYVYRTYFVLLRKNFEGHTVACVQDKDVIWKVIFFDERERRIGELGRDFENPVTNLSLTLQH